MANSICIDFHPRDVKALVPDYLDECKERGISDVRNYSRQGHGCVAGNRPRDLETSADVLTYYLTDHNWGSTSVVLNLKTQS